jgi:MerR family transcriptional regulator, copper efflux regulator
MDGLTIGNAAKKAGVGIETIRFYERKGLIARPPRPRDGGFRVYSKSHVERVRFIRRAQSLGFSLREVHELLSLEANPKATCSDVHARAVNKLEEVEQKIAGLRAVKAALKSIISTCPKRGFAAGQCTILEALASDKNGKTKAK